MKDIKTRNVAEKTIKTLDKSLIVAKARNKMEKTIVEICGTEEGAPSSYNSGLTGLSEYGNSWVATVFSSEKCGKNE